MTPTFYWMQGATAHSARLRPFSLLPSETKSIDVRSLLTSAGIGAYNGSVNLVLESQDKLGSLLLASGSVDQKNTYVFQVLPHSIQESESKTISYWSTANGDDTMVTIWNPADEGQDYQMTLFFTGGRYHFLIHLQARATRVFNISEIIQNQIPDDDGNIVPATVHEGSAKIAGAHADNEQILVALDSGTYNVRKATCSFYCISCDGTVLAYAVVTPFGMGKGGNYQLSFTGQNHDGTQYAATGTWSSNKTAVATVTAINSGLNGKVTGVSSGTATFTATGFGSVYSSSYCAYDPHCPYNTSFQGSGSGTVCDFTIFPASFLANNCTGSSQNSNIFNTTVTPATSQCLADSVKSSCSESSTGNIDFAVSSPHCVFSPGNPGATVSYFAGPKMSNGTAGTIGINFNLVFNKTAVSHSGSATIQCP